MLRPDVWTSEGGSMMLHQNQTFMGKRDPKIHAESPATTMNILCKMAMISWGHEEKLEKGLRKWKAVSVILTRLVTTVLKLAVHHHTQDLSDFFKTTTCPPFVFSGPGIAFLEMRSCFPTSSSARSSHRCSFTPVLVCLIVYSHRSSSNPEWHKKLVLFPQLGLHISNSRLFNQLVLLWMLLTLI